MVHTHQHSCDEVMTMPLPPQQCEKIWHGPSDPKNFYSCTIERILTCCIPAWYGKCLASDRKTLQRVMHTAQDITGAELPAIQNLYTRWGQRRAIKIFKDSSPPSQRLFSLLPRGKRYQCTKSGTNRTLNNFYPKPQDF